MNETRLGVIGGCGHIGLVQAAGLAALGYPTLAYDKDTTAIRSLEKGILPFYEPGLQELIQRTTQDGTLTFTDRVTRLREVDLFYICVGTPAQDSGESDTSQVENVVEMISNIAAGPAVAVIKSTVPVGTARRLSRRLAETGRAAKITVVSNPEFLAEGSGVDDFMHPSRIIVGGEDDKAVEETVSIYAPPGTPVITTTWENAELIKYAANAFLAARLSYINEIALLCERAGGDIRTISKGIGLDPRIGPLYLEAGAGFGGPCLEKDLRSLIFQFSRVGTDASLLTAVLEVNRRQRLQLVRKLTERLGDLKGKQIAVLGLAFKPGTDDWRDSQSIPIIEHLLSLGAAVTVHDPLVGISREKRRLSERFPALTWADSPYNAAKGKDGLLFLTGWPEYKELELEKLKRRLAVSLIVDGRNLFAPEKARRLKIEYRGVGL